MTVGCPLGMTWHSMAGVEQGQASGSDRIFRLFIDLGVNFPFPYHHNSQVAADDGFFGRRLRLWSNFRLTSAPRQFDTTLPNAIDSAIQNATLSNVAQAVELLGGLEFRLADTADAHLSIGGTRERFSFHAVVAAGLTSALANETPVTLYLDIRSPASSPRYYAIVSPPNVSSYPGQYYAGFRWKTFYFDPNDHLLNIAPTTIDMLFGHDAAGSRPSSYPPSAWMDYFPYRHRKPTSCTSSLPSSQN